MKLVVVTATTNYDRAKPCIDSWGDAQKVLVYNGREREVTPGDVAALNSRAYLGTVPAFRAGVDYALDHTDADVIACLHDDLQILDPDWVEKVVRLFERHPACGLAGFGGAIGLGAHDIYQTPYNPMQLARIGFRSNLIDAEVHGVRSLLSERVAALDGFSLVGRRDFYAGYRQSGREDDRPWTWLEDEGCVHHAYDSGLSAIAARYGWQVWYLPIRARHYGGATAVGDQGYQAWAKDQIPGGDQGFWEQSHKHLYAALRDVLPIRL